MRLDKNYFRKHSFAKASDHQSNYKRMSDEERSEAFHYMMQATYSFVGLPWPTMDKQHFEKKSRQ